MDPDKADSHEEDLEHDEMFAGADTWTTRSNDTANRPLAPLPSQDMRQDTAASNASDSSDGVEAVERDLQEWMYGQRHGHVPSPGEEAGRTLPRTLTHSQPLPADSQRPTKGSLLQHIQETGSGESATSQTETRRAKSTKSNVYNNTGILGQGTQLDNTGSSAVPGYSQGNNSILNPIALGLVSTQGRVDPGLTASTFEGNFFEQHQTPTSHPSYAQGTNEAWQPERVYVSESEIDFEGPDDLDDPETEGEVVEERSQKRSKKEDSESVAGMQKGKEKKTKVENDKKEKGQVRKLKDGSGMAFRDSKNPQWTKGRYHYKLREQFIADDKSSQRPYDWAPTTGGAVTDVTSWCTDQKAWTSDLETIQDPNRRELLSDDYVSGEFVEKKPPDWLLPDGTVVLDAYGHPVRKFSNIPNTLSSQTEEWRLEGLRALNMMTINDLIARMPKYTETWRSVGGTLKLVKERLPGPSGFTNRIMTWRKKVGKRAPGKGRKGQDSQREGQRKRRKLDVNDPSNNKKGTEAQRATARFRDLRAKAPQGTTRSQPGPMAPISPNDQPVQPSHWRPLADQPQHGLPPHAVGIKTSAADGTNIKRGPTVDSEAENPGRFPTQNPPYYPTHQWVSNPELLRPPLLAPPAFPLGHSPQPWIIDPTIFAGGPYTQNQLPNSIPASDQPMTGDHGSQSSGSSDIQYTNPRTDPAAEALSGPQQQDSNFSRNEPTFKGLDSNNTQNQVPQGPDFREQRPTTQRDMDEIEIALARTHDSFAAVHGYERLPKIIHHANYNENRYFLQLEHVKLCKMSDKPVTLLLGLGPWYEDFENHVYATRE